LNGVAMSLLSAIADDPRLAPFVALHRAPEPDVLLPLLAEARVSPGERGNVLARAAGLLGEIRAAEMDGWVNRFLQQYRLNTDEGRALLSLAEAFLRVPDTETADALIRDKVGGADWDAHAGRSASPIVNASTWGLTVSRALLSDEGGVLKRLVQRAGEPFVRTAVGAAMRLMADLFVMGRTIGEALDRADAKDYRDFTASFDMLGEAARTAEDADRYFRAYQEAVEAVGRRGNSRGHSVSVKLSALWPRYETAQAETALPAIIARVEPLAVSAAGLGVPLTIDAEEQDRLLLSLHIIEAVAGLPALAGWDGLGLAIQAYGKRARPLIDWASGLAERSGRRLSVRLVKGAYWDSEVKRAQEAGVAGYPLFTRKAATDVSYLACARALLEAPRLFPAFASHNALTVATIAEWAGSRRDFEFQRLHGMGAGLYERMVREEGYSCRLYAPVGGHRDLLAYLVRRLLENGANSSFVHQLADEAISEAELLADPVEKVMASGGAPSQAIPLPADLFRPSRANSAGLDLQDPATLEATRAAVAAAGAGRFRAAPLVAGRAIDGIARPVVAPFDPDLVVGEVLEATADTVSQALAAAVAAQPVWDATPVDARAAILERLADRLEEDRPVLLWLLQAEAGKTLPDALADLREAVDFCRYYAVEARRSLAAIALPGPTGEANVLRLHGRGVFATIAPWNFPLAIFLGQTVAALVAGNAVMAKPAPQTPLVAARAIAHAHAAGVPPAVLALLPGGGAVGQALVADPRVGGVAFTGSTRTARAIARTLLDDDTRPLVPLIAETGGLNAMIVDSTALPEQVVADVITSAFRSAGQRCSALRLLILQEEVAEGMLAMLKGAMDTLVVGDPRAPETDIGPVIDGAARERLVAYLEACGPRVIHRLRVPARGHFVPPAIVRLDRIEDLREEWFGPVLHVTTWAGGAIEPVVACINASGFGLTMGLHSRIAGVAEAVGRAARVGNLYVNRSMIGAVVGSQPFGGEGFSGTGPKAGGPHYLPRFATERVTSTDTTSAGGNAGLLSISE
jgi:RHH-type proline utilization regulon transcriptional repressor/proline dehydrogenase/delta 1-pyrroline-5-carboxylate dehydrogenase